MKMDTRFKAQAQIMTPYSRGKQKLKVNGKTQIGKLNETYL